MDLGMVMVSISYETFELLKVIEIISICIGVGVAGLLVTSIIAIIRGLR